MARSFYDELAPYYHLLYPDWDASIARQARGLAAVFDEFGAPKGGAVLDAACGIGTQALGLAALGYRVSASDVAPEAVERARREAAARNVSIDFGVADLRELSTAYGPRFSAVIACDNAIPHLLNDAEIQRAFEECRRCLLPGGIVVISVRDYDHIERRTPDVRPYGTHAEHGHNYSAEQIWVWDGDQYDLTMRLVDEDPRGEQAILEFHTRYYAIGAERLAQLMIDAGFVSVERRDDRFFQPLFVGVSS